MSHAAYAAAAPVSTRTAGRYRETADGVGIAAATVKKVYIYSRFSVVVSLSRCAELLSVEEEGWSCLFEGAQKGGEGAWRSENTRLLS